VKFIPHVPHDEVHTIYQHGDVLVLPTLYEGSALVVNEAMASGLPVITTPNAGSAVQDGVEGFIIPIRDADALISRIEALYEDPKLRAEMGHRARRKALEQTWAEYRKGVLALWRKMEAAPMAKAG
jgi:glycosyltransferase involved in cell wall biosynthesis